MGKGRLYTGEETPYVFSKFNTLKYGRFLCSPSVSQCLLNRVRLYFKEKSLYSRGSFSSPRDRRFLVTRGSTGRLQIKPSGSGDENVLRLFLLRMT